ncbi:hypothetical protein D3C85_1464700 [compost metagenome]
MHRSELPYILVPQLTPIRKSEQHMGMQFERIITCVQAIAAFHAQMGNHHIVCEHESQKLPSPFNRFNGLPLQERFKLLNIVRFLDNTRQPYLNTGDRFPCNELI